MSSRESRCVCGGSLSPVTTPAQQRADLMPTSTLDWSPFLGRSLTQSASQEDIVSIHCAWSLESSGTGDLEPEHIYGVSTPPVFATRREAEQSRHDLLVPLLRVAPSADLRVVGLSASDLVDRMRDELTVDAHPADGDLSWYLTWCDDRDLETVCQAADSWPSVEVWISGDGSAVGEVVWVRVLPQSAR